MSVDRIKFQNIVESQVPDFVRDDFPLLSDFLKQYYISQEFESGTYDLIQNIDQYVKIDELTNLTTSTELGEDLSYTNTSIKVSNNAGIGNFTEYLGKKCDLLVPIDISDEYIKQLKKRYQKFDFIGWMPNRM